VVVLGGVVVVGGVVSVSCVLFQEGIHTQSTHTHYGVADGGGDESRVRQGCSQT